MMEAYLEVIAEYVALSLETLSVVIVAVGGLEAAYRTLFPMLLGRINHGHSVRRDAWLSLARWLLLGLEFMLAADIVRSTISPDWEGIAQLGAIAVIRTFLNYFLERDLEAAAELKEPA